MREFLLPVLPSLVALGVGWIVRGLDARAATVRAMELRVVTLEAQMSAVLARLDEIADGIKELRARGH